MFEVTPENVFVFYSFESILSGLLSFVLIWAFYKDRTLIKRPNLVLLLAAQGLLALAFFLCSALNFYEFYYQQRLLGQDPENVAFGFFLLAGLLLGIASRQPFSLRGATAWFLIGASGLGLIDLFAHLSGRAGSHWPLHWLALSVVFAAFQILFSSSEDSPAARLLLRVTLVGFSFGFFFIFLQSSSPHHTWARAWWVGQNLAFLGSMVALAHFIETVTRDLFVKFFIRLNLTFILLAGFIILLVAGIQRQEYVGFAAREADDLMEFVRGHVMYFERQGHEY
jgi:hypothetical protein